MDGLSSAASVIAVVSLAVQLADTAKQLCDFWTSIKDAPEDIRTIVADLELLNGVLAEMASESQHTGPDKTLTAVLQSCAGKLKSLTALTANLEPGFASKSLRTRKWTAFKFVLKGEKLRRFQEVLESLKSTLVLGQQNRQSCLIRAQHEIQLGKLTTIVQSLSLQQSGATVTTCSKDPADTRDHIAALQAETSRVGKNIEDPLLRLGFAVGSEKATQQILNNIETTDSAYEGYANKSTFSASDVSRLEGGKGFLGAKPRTKRTWTVENITNYFFGTISTQSTTRQLQSHILDHQDADDEDGNYEHQSSFVIRPAAWLVNLGLKSGLRVGLFNSSVRGWQNSINTFCAVPDDSLIFELSMDGDLSAIRGLFSRGLASVRDTNSDGETPLYIAAEYHHFELCRFLLAAGADRSVRCGKERKYGKSFSPIMAACNSSTMSLQSTTAIDTLRLFTDEMDFVEADGDGWTALHCLGDTMSGFLPDPTRNLANLDPFVWALRVFSLEIRACFIENLYAGVLGTAFWLETETADRLLLELGPVGAVDIIEHEGGYTALQNALVFHYDTSHLDIILEFKPDLHHLGFNSSYSPQEETPLSLALYSSYKSRQFINALKKQHCDLDDFVLQELREDLPLTKDGWTARTLRELCEDEFEPDTGNINPTSCEVCGSIWKPVEIAWQLYILKFRETHSQLAAETTDRYEDLVDNDDVSISPESEGSWHTQIASQRLNCHKDSMDEISEVDTHDQTFRNPLQDLDEENGSEIEGSDTDRSGYSYSTSELVEGDSDQESREQRFWQHTVVCIHCWLDFKRGIRKPRRAWPDLSEDEEDCSEDSAEDSEDGFSPYLFNT